MQPSTPAEAAAARVEQDSGGPPLPRPAAKAPAQPDPAEAALPRLVRPSGLRIGPPEAHRPSARPGRDPKPAAPDVHITIGRVEIRAVAAASTPERPRKPAPAPVESLADYLARRDGQRR